MAERRHMQSAEKRSQKDLEADGWTRQFIASEPRLSEAREAYEEMGLEVRLEPVDTEGLDQECTDCLEMDDSCRLIYTRPKKGKGTR